MFYSDIHCMMRCVGVKKRKNQNLVLPLGQLLVRFSPSAGHGRDLSADISCHDSWALDWVNKHR